MLLMSAFVLIYLIDINRLRWYNNVILFININHLMEEKLWTKSGMKEK